MSQYLTILVLTHTHKTNATDSHEFLNFLLCGLHEDMNRVRKKPGPEKRPFGTESSILVGATETMQLLSRRDDSVVTDMFRGL